MMSPATEKFLRESAPFVVVHRFPRAALSGWAIRDGIGEHVALCDDEDAARALAEALNDAGERVLPSNNKLTDPAP